MGAEVINFNRKGSSPYLVGNKKGLVFYRYHKGIFVIHQVKDKPLVFITSQTTFVSNIHHAAKFSALPKRALRQISTINLQLERLSRWALFNFSSSLP